MKKDKKDVDALLEALLPCNSQQELQLAAHRLAETLEWGQRDDGRHRDGQPLERFLWGLATRLQEYGGPEARTARGGMPFTWCEIKVIKHATMTRSQEAKENRIAAADAAYLAMLLQRSEGEVLEAMRIWGPAQGRRGFF